MLLYLHCMNEYPSPKVVEGKLKGPMNKKWANTQTTLVAGWHYYFQCWGQKSQKKVLKKKTNDDSTILMHVLTVTSSILEVPTLHIYMHQNIQKDASIASFRFTFHDHYLLFFFNFSLVYLNLFLSWWKFIFLQFKDCYRILFGEGLICFIIL